MNYYYVNENKNKKELDQVGIEMSPDRMIDIYI
jgi:hypothetical protein